MKTTVVRVLSFCFALCLALSGWQAAMAEVITGSTSGETTFYVKADSSNAFIVLSSSSGLANVNQHSLGLPTGTGDEKHDGFYEVIQSGTHTYNSFIWAPSATANTSEVNDCQEVQVNFPAAGDYVITVRPLSNEAAARYWIMDTINYWVYPATWMTSIASGCQVSSKPFASPTVANGPTITTKPETAPSLPQAQLPTLSGQPGAWINSNGNIAVYTGPGTNYYRSASGKAAVASGEAVTVYGRVGDWVLIQYNAVISSKNLHITRFAYIPDNYVERGPKYAQIQFASIPIRISSSAQLVDEPSTTHYFNSFRSGSIQYNNAIALADIYVNGQRWIYFECTATSSQGTLPFRGFVQERYVTWP